MSLKNPLKLAFGLEFKDLYRREGLLKLDDKFAAYLLEKNSAIAQKFNELKQNKTFFSPAQQSAILIDKARFVEEFLAELFCIKKENSGLKKHHAGLKVIYQIRREFVQRIVAKKIDEAGFLELLKRKKIKDLNNNHVFKAEMLPDCVFAAEFGLKILQKLKIIYTDITDLEKQLAQRIAAGKNLKILTDYTAWALYNKNGQKFHKNGALFILPQKIDHQNLLSFMPQKIQLSQESAKEINLEINLEINGETAEEIPGEIKLQQQLPRSGFDLTDKGFSLNRVLAETSYCLFCHQQQKDSCRSGIKEKNSPDLKIDPLGVELGGCPLDQKISEMNFLKAEGLSLAALAVACIDNPMLAGTGHRICNDCMKSCIYQKQDPVDIPQIETKILKDVLSLPYGFEIYSLLTRWNPLHLEKNLPQENSGKKILIAGLGPAGYTLAHYLLNDGHTIVAIDGLKIEPLKPEISGIDALGNHIEFQPIKFLDEIYEPLSTRLIQGFGGVAEYGITARFDKNFLKIIRLLLERRKNFRMFGGIRFGSSITDKTAFENYGFDHVALCIGAGRPHIVNLKNNFAKGVRLASDFLMALQLGGAFKKESLTNLQIRMPVVVIGGGLTAVDTACEAWAYYLVQIRNFAKKIKKIRQSKAGKKVLAALSLEEKIIAREFLRHAAELEKLAPDGTKKNTDILLKKWGGVKIIYRNKIQDSPAYKINHQELNAAFLQGIEFIENITPAEIETDQFGHIKNLHCAGDKFFKAGSLLIAAGTSPNISPIAEDGLDFKIEGNYFSKIDADNKYLKARPNYCSKHFNFITKIDENSGKTVSFFGDLHPDFTGSVVKAMASAKLGYKQITEIIALQEEVFLPAKKQPEQKLSKFNKSKAEFHVKKNIDFFQQINSEFSVKIAKIIRLSNHVVEIFVKAPLLAKKTQVGHIFRLQNYQPQSQSKSGKTQFKSLVATELTAMEGVALTALEVDRVNGVIRSIALESGASTNLIKNFKAGQACIFMGPSGQPTTIPRNETVVLVGGGRGNQPLTAIAKACKTNGCKVIFFAGYRKNSFVVRQKEMENCCDILVFAVEEKPHLKLKRTHNFQFKGLVTEALQDYFRQNPQKIDRIFTIGNDDMMHEIARLRHKNLAASISGAKIAIASLNSPMQCMLKGVCSQCLQKRKNKKDEWEYFYACSQQDQNMDQIDFEHLHQRCRQNSLTEKISKFWQEMPSQY
jgi:NADPH-dependent glutamate synthase beta subunit-like oxidoreductase/NAD(P)H-flavin reductase